MTYANSQALRARGGAGLVSEFDKREIMWEVCFLFVVVVAAAAAVVVVNFCHRLGRTHAKLPRCTPIKPATTHPASQPPTSK